LSGNRVWNKIKIKRLACARRFCYYIIMQVIPTINADSFEEIKKRIKMVEPYVGWVQIDVSDNSFGAISNWNNPSDLDNFKTSVKMEVHLMMDNLEEKIDSWLASPIDRIIFHLETVKDAHVLIDRIKKAEKEVGIAIAPDTEWVGLMQYCDRVNIFQILAVNPGPSGQEFQEKCLDKIKNLRANCSSATIEVDGGVNKEIAQKIKNAGADIVVAGSYIFDSKDVKKSVEELKAV